MPFNIKRGKSVITGKLKYSIIFRCHIFHFVKWPRTTYYIKVIHTYKWSWSDHTCWLEDLCRVWWCKLQKWSMQGQSRKMKATMCQRTWQLDVPSNAVIRRSTPICIVYCVVRRWYALWKRKQRNPKHHTSASKLHFLIIIPLAFKRAGPTTWLGDPTKRGGRACLKTHDTPDYCRSEFIIILQISDTSVL